MFDFAEWAQGSLSGARARGRELTADCPFCGRAGRFKMNLETGSWLCNRQEKCSAKGRGSSGLVALVAQADGVSEAEARALVFRQSYEPAPRRDAPEELVGRFRGVGETAPALKTVDVALPAEFVPVWDGSTWRHPSYLSGRGVTRETARAWGMGFCESGRYRNRVVLPIVCPNGASFTARSVDGREPRYLNPRCAEPGCRDAACAHPRADHGRLLVGWNVAVADERDDADLVLCEGPLDALALYQMGVRALSLGGNRLREAQLSLLCRLNPGRRVFVMLDPTEETSPRATCSMLRSYFRVALVARLRGAGPGGSKLDPGCASREQVFAALDAAEAPSRGAGLAARFARL